jgi:hypothetical protein
VFAKGTKPHNFVTRKYQEFECEACGKECKRYRREKPYRFCSDKKCQQQRYSGMGHPSWRGGRYKVGAGYILVRTGNNKREYEHRVIAERVLGRKLKRTEEVHHVNSIKSDNRNGNLLICDIAYHRLLESVMSIIYQLQYFGGLSHDTAIKEAQRIALAGRVQSAIISKQHVARHKKIRFALSRTAPRGRSERLRMASIARRDIERQNTAQLDLFSWN